jgi:hypothetical protein
MPWGEVYNGSTLVDMYLAELATHAWDLAISTGQTPGDPELAVLRISAGCDGWE